MSIFPKGSSKSAEDNSSKSADFSPGAVVLYEHDGSALLGIITKFEKLRYSLLNMRGRELQLSPQRLAPLPGKAPSDLSSNSAKAEWLSALLERCEAKKGEVDMLELWELLHEEGGDYSAHDLASLLGSSPSLEDELTVLLAVTSDRIYFKRRKFLFQTRPEETVEELKRAEEARKKREATQKSLKLHFEEGGELSAEASELLEELKNYACDSVDFNQSYARELKAFVDALRKERGITRGKTPSERAYQLLRDVGVFDEFTNTAVSRYGLSHDFPADCMEQAKSLQERQSKDSAAKTSDARWTVTIDDSGTRDMDDALSIRQLEGGGFEFGVHITRVSALIDFDSALASELRARATSVYIPDGVFHMLPPSLSEQVFSLVAQKAHPVVSLYLETNAQYEILSSRMVADEIFVDEKLSYDEVDEMLSQGHPQLTAINGLAAHCEMSRMDKGALRMPKQDAIISLGEKRGEVKLRIIDEGSPARSLIGEMMVLFNGEAAKTIDAAGLPAIFRCQERSEFSEKEQERIDSIPEGPARAYASRGGLKRSTQQLSAAPHATLGLDFYCQCSSPIRRAADYLNQYQLLACIDGSRTALNEEQVSLFLADMEAPLGIAGSASRESKRFWLLHYIKQNHRGDTFHGTVVRNDGKLPLIEIHDIPLFNIAYSARKLELGAEVQIRVKSVIPEEGELRLEVQ